MTDMTAQIDEALAGWTEGSAIVATKNDMQFNERTVVTKNDNGYSIYRAFPIGDSIAVSADKQDISQDAMIAHLLGGE